MYPITPERCLDDIKWARETMHYANPIDGLYALKRQGDERACEMSQRTAQGQDGADDSIDEMYAAIGPKMASAACRLMLFL
jgi:hypothetical protein